MWNSRDTEVGPEQFLHLALQHSHPSTSMATQWAHASWAVPRNANTFIKTLIAPLGILWGRKSTFADPTLLFYNKKEIKNLGEKNVTLFFLLNTHTKKIFKSEYLPTAKYWGEKGGVIIPVPPGSLRACVFLWWLACGFVVHYSFPEPYILLKHKYRPTNLLTSWSIGSRTLRGIMLLPPWCSPLFRKRREKEREWKKKSSIV